MRDEMVYLDVDASLRSTPSVAPSKGSQNGAMRGAAIRQINGMNSER